MHDILTVTLNPTVDLSTSVAHVVPGDKLRCAPPVTDPGGGGINVSRAIRLLGGESLALVALGGHNGDKLRALLEH
ncbi:PfkB family carbohydrate kinase, partial [Rhodovulum sulfidophilum]|nr:PfkB family carbohydrate kinase [Rhodovulum sulfidophilum]